MNTIYMAVYFLIVKHPNTWSISALGCYESTQKKFFCSNFIQHTAHHFWPASAFSIHYLMSVLQLSYTLMVLIFAVIFIRKKLHCARIDFRGWLV